MPPVPGSSRLPAFLAGSPPPILSSLVVLGLLTCFHKEEASEAMSSMEKEVMPQEDHSAVFGLVNREYDADLVAQMLRCHWPKQQDEDIVKSPVFQAGIPWGENAQQPNAAVEQQGERPPCAACRHLHRSCVPECVFAPHFPPGDDLARFGAVEAVYDADLVADLLRTVPLHQRGAAANNLVYQARALLRDPVYGSTITVDILHTRLQQVKAQLAALRKDPARYIDVDDAYAWYARYDPAQEDIPKQEAFVETMKMQMLKQCEADARAGISNFVTPLHESIVKEMARQIAEEKQQAGEVAKEPGAAPLIDQQQQPSQAPIATAGGHDPSQGIW